MSKEELIKKLKELGVLNRYSLDGYIAPNMTVLYPNATSWDLFFVDEKGEYSRPISFLTPKDAYEYIFHLENRIAERHKSSPDNRTTHTIVTQVSGDGFVMTKTDKVYIPPEDMKKE